MTGDAIIKIQGQNTDIMKHKEAQDAIIRAGNNIEINIQRYWYLIFKEISFINFRYLLHVKFKKKYCICYIKLKCHKSLLNTW